MITIDNTEVKNITIDGIDVQSITMDGQTIWQKLVDAGVLRSIEVGDDLTGKLLYFGFPDNFNQTMLQDYSLVIMTGVCEVATFKNGSTSSNVYYYNSVTTLGGSIYYKDNVPTFVNLVTLTAPTGFGIVTQINANNPAYKYIKIIDDGLRNLEVGDVIGNKKLYLNFPNSSYLYDQKANGKIFDTSGGQSFQANYVSGAVDYIGFGGSSYVMCGGDTAAYQGGNIFSYSPPSSTPSTNVKWMIPDISVSSDSKITYINKTNPAYQFIKIRKKPYYKNIEVGDNLSDANLYMAFPDDFNTSNIVGNGAVITGQYDGGVYDIIHTYRNDGEDMNFVVVGFTSVYDYYAGSVKSNLSKTKLDSLFGNITSINTSNPAYKYVFVKMRNIEANDLLTNMKLYLDFPNNYYHTLKALNTISGETQQFFIDDSKSISDIEFVKFQSVYSQTDNNNNVSVYQNNLPSLILYNKSTIKTSELNTDRSFIVYGVNNKNISYPFISIIDRPKLRHIKVGDNLNGKTIYCNFPRDIGLDLGDWSGDRFISTTVGYYTIEEASSSGSWVRRVSGLSGREWLYEYDTNKDIVNYNNTSIVSTKGTVTSINTNNIAYQYMWIMD